MGAVAIGIVAGTASGLFGIGGGLVMVPGLVIALGLSQHRAHANSLGAVILIAAASGIPYAVSGHVVWLLSLSMALTAVVAARLGARLMHRLSEEQLKLLFGLLMLAVAVRMFAGVSPVPGAEQTGNTAMLVFGGLVIGVVVGLCSSLLGIGGGLIMVPAMVLVMGLPQHLAEGTSLMAIVPTALSGTLAHRRSGYVDPVLVLALAGAGILAGLVSSTVALNLDELVLQRGMAILVVVALVRMVGPVVLGQLRRSTS